MAGQLSALLIMTSERRHGLIPSLKKFSGELSGASTYREAAQILRDNPAIRVILTDVCLPDGTWLDVQREVGSRSRVVVCPRLGDEQLWEQVLEAGAFDVLVEPYHAPEVARILEAAAAPGSAMAAAD